MNAKAYRFLEPLDVLFLRGNKLFGDPGSFGESLVPPWPSVVAGALRSRMLADDRVDLAAFARGDLPHPLLGTPDRPGPFTISEFALACRHSDGSVEPLRAPPADLFIALNESGDVEALPLAPARVCGVLVSGASICSSSSLPLLAVLADSKRRKPASGYWLRESGWKKYLMGEAPNAGDLIATNSLWSMDHRVGVGLDAATRRAADGHLFSVEAVAMKKRWDGGADGRDVGFLVETRGGEPPADGVVRLGGDGRAAAVHTVALHRPEPDYAAIAAARRCRLVLSTPGLFFSDMGGAGKRESGGWLPTGLSRGDDGGYVFDLQGVRGRLVCAAVPRAEVVSGWDLARGRPKPALRAVPTGSVYWLDDIDADPEALRNLAESGLWSEPCEDEARRAEGFSRVAVAAWR